MARKDKKPSEDTAQKRPKKSPQQIFAEKVRYHKDLESRWAILQEARVEYFRGKDFSLLLQKHPELANTLFPPEEWAQIKQPLDHALMGELLENRLVVRCDRVMKTVRPGKKKLSKWPARIEFHPSQVFSSEDGFYSWTFERQSPLWQTVLTILFPIFTVACCLFPVFPHWAKLTVLYFLLSLIAGIFMLLFVRLAVFTVIWVFTGRRMWYFPRILEEEGTLAELFRFWPDKDEEPPSKITTRAAVALMLGFTFWLMVHYAPDQNTRAKYQKRVTNIIDEFAAWSPRMIASNTTEPAPANATANGTTNGTASTPSANDTYEAKLGDENVDQKSRAEAKAQEELATEGLKQKSEL